MLPFFPSADEVIRAATSSGWNSAEPGAITATYDQDTGTWRRAGFKFKITCTNPIKAKGTDGKRTFIYKSKISASVPGNRMPVQAVPYLNHADDATPTNVSPVSGNLITAKTKFFTLLCIAVVVILIYTFFFRR